MHYSCQEESLKCVIWIHWHIWQIAVVGHECYSILVPIKTNKSPARINSCTRSSRKRYLGTKWQTFSDGRLTFHTRIRGLHAFFLWPGWKGGSRGFFQCFCWSCPPPSRKRSRVFACYRFTRRGQEWADFSVRSNHLVTAKKFGNREITFHELWIFSLPGEILYTEISYKRTQRLKVIPSLAIIIYHFGMGKDFIKK